MNGLPLPGRLGDDEATPANDSRLHPKLLPFLRKLGVDERSPGTEMTPKTSPEEIHAVMEYVDGFAMHDSIPCDLPGDEKEPKVDITTITTTGVDKNEIALHIFRKAGTQGKLPGVVYIHGGAMVFLKTRSAVHDRWCTSLALEGVVTIALDFRNAYTKEAYNPFPAGLNDCAAGIQYVAAHKDELGISSIVLTGESGGANLGLATALKALKEGWISQISGVYALEPYISNCWGKPREWLLRNLQSVVENDGYFNESTMSTLMGHYYTPEEADKTNPLAWPYHATVDEMKGLPPHVISVNELDMLRDEGIAYGRKLQAAEVDVVSKTILGAVHAAELFRHYVPELHYDAVGSITSFARRVARTL